MEIYQELIKTISLTMGVAWASGINLYATIAILGILGITGSITLPEKLAIVQHPAVIAAASFMYLVEFFADKMPGVDTGWDVLHTFIRVPAGVVLAAAATGDVSTPVVLSAAIVGGVVSGTSHLVKSGSRVMINASPEPFSNWTASVVEDVVVIGGLWTALHYPLVFLTSFLFFIILAIWLLPKLFRAVKKMLNALFNFFRSPAIKEDYNTNNPMLINEKNKN